jgi:DNA-binding IclR family transcriptional regulator
MFEDMDRTGKNIRRGRPPQGGASEGEGAQSILRASKLLFALAEGRSGLGHRASRLAERLELRQPTVHRMLKALASQGLVIQDETTARWRLGYAIYELGLSASPHQALLAAAEPVLARITEATGETSLLVVRSGHDGVCLGLAKKQPSGRGQPVDVGTRRPLGVGATGVAMLAALDQVDADTAVRQNTSRFAAYDGLDQDRVAQLVKEARRNGYARTHGEFYPHVASVSVAWRMSRHAVVSISVASTILRMGQSQVVNAADLLRKEVAVLRESMRGQGAPQDR